MKLINTTMKNLLLLLITAFILTSCSSQGYSPAFEANHVFKTNAEKYTYLSKKYNIKPLHYFIECDEDSTEY